MDYRFFVKEFRSWKRNQNLNISHMVSTCNRTNALPFLPSPSNCYFFDRDTQKSSFCLDRAFLSWVIKSKQWHHSTHHYSPGFGWWYQCHLRKLVVESDLLKIVPSYFRNFGISVHFFDKGVENEFFPRGPFKFLFRFIARCKLIERPSLI